MLYDGACPFCRQEVRWLSYWNRNGNLIFEDITGPSFDPAKYGVTFDEVHGTLYGVLADGSIVRGVEVFRQAYKAVGLGWVVAPTGWPLLRPIFDFAYRVFARYRVRLGRLFGRNCSSDSCSVPNRNSVDPTEPTLMED